MCSIFMAQPEENKVIIDGGSNQPRIFFKVNVNCWEKIFDFLSLRDILAMSQTCQRMCRIGGRYFRENFQETICNLHKYLGPSLRSNKTNIDLENVEFLRFIDTVSICGRMENLEHYSSVNLLPSLTTLRLCLVNFNTNEALGCESVLNNIETIELIECYINGDSVIQLLESCSKLKRLQIVAVDFEPTAGENSIFQQTFPALNYFQYTDCDRVAPVISFLERNSSIKYLRIGASDLWRIQSNTSTIQLDCLILKMDLTVNKPVEFANLLKTLHANGFYKPLHSLIEDVTDDFDLESFINEMKSFEAVEVLYTCQFYKNICHLTELNELYLQALDIEIDLELIANNLTKLKRLWIDGTIDHLLTFLCHSKTLKMVIMQIIDGNSSENALNLLNLNHARQMSAIRRKVLVGVFEDIYLATKWKEKTMNCNLIEIVRAETIFKHFMYKNTHSDL